MLVACSSEEETPRTDAPLGGIDAHELDASLPPDASPDAPPGAALTACLHACKAVATCVGVPDDPKCAEACTTDLVDCSPDQVAAVDACSLLECGDLSNNMSPLIDCLTAITCIDEAAALQSR